MQRTTAPLMSAAQASQLLDHEVHERVRELIDFCCLLDFEQELWAALLECGLPREEIPRISAQLIARALTRIGEEHVKLATEPDRPARPPD
jgi:hypothetical protein